jgi:hypothetical protein
MIIPNQKNLKVHFAGSENLEHLIIIRGANIKYSLFSVFKFICHHFDLKGANFLGNKSFEEIARMVDTLSRHSIMDSGLFTLMFGSQKGEQSFDFLDRWQNKLVEFVLESGYKGVCVEIDCQKVLNPDAAWKFRYKLKDLLPDNTIMNVFHIEDGQAGLDRLIEYSDYIALSIPELRILKKKEYAYRIASYIKEKKPDINIHLLGCTELKMLRTLKFCETSDSSSWNSGVRFGGISTVYGQKFDINKVEKDEAFIAPYVEIVRQVKEELDIVCNYRETRTAAMVLGAIQAKQIYAKAAGSQE